MLGRQKQQTVFNAIRLFNPPPKMNVRGILIPVLDDKVEAFATSMLASPC